MRENEHRYHNLPQRTPQMLLQVVRKFYRGATNHYSFIQEKKAEVLHALKAAPSEEARDELDRALNVLFLEFHFYVTCWMQMELALYRLSRQPKGEHYKAIFQKYREELSRHVHVRGCLNDTSACVQAQWRHFQGNPVFIDCDEYWFDGVLFSVNEESLDQLHQLYEEIMSKAVGMTGGL